jgi:hypothetical protein
MPCISRERQTICLNPGTIAVGPKYRKYGTWVRFPELTEVPPIQPSQYEHSRNRAAFPTHYSVDCQQLLVYPTLYLLAVVPDWRYPFPLAPSF